MNLFDGRLQREPKSGRTREELIRFIQECLSKNRWEEFPAAVLTFPDWKEDNSEIVVLDKEFIEEDLPDIDECIYHSLNHLISTTNRIIRDENNLILGTFRVKVIYTPE